MVKSVLPQDRLNHTSAEVPGFDQIGLGGGKLPARMFKPQFHIQCRYAQLPIADGLPHYVSVPPLFGGSDEQMAW